MALGTISSISSTTSDVPKPGVHTSPSPDAETAELLGDAGQSSGESDGDGGSLAGGFGGEMLAMAAAAAAESAEALRESHVLAERRRRREIKGLLEALRRALPGEFFRRGRASKWEILARAVEHVGVLTRAADERDRLRVELARCRAVIDSYTAAVPLSRGRD
ncbi:hypothetical protein HK405_001028 [Cladochytrium tenue]|nr:hypothetical protein HK405_001028 [Cladochytrium tenue]